MTRLQAPGECLKPVLERKHALQAARRLRTRDQTVAAYRCAACGGWHVGSSSGFKPPARVIRANHQIFSKGHKA